MDSVADPFFHGCLERPYSDPCSTKIVALINLQESEQFVFASEYFFHLITGYCIKTTAKACELNELQILFFAYIGSRTVEPVMVGPLIHHTKGPFYLRQMCYRVFCQYSHSLLYDQIRNAMMHFWIHVVRSSCKNNALMTSFIQITDHFFTFLSDILLIGFHLTIPFSYSFLYFRKSDGVVF